MSDFLIGPGQGCPNCGEGYGGHKPNCRYGTQLEIKRREQAEEDAITKRELLRRIEALESVLKEKE